MATVLPLRTSQSLTFSSCEPVATKDPCGLKATQLTKPLCDSTGGSADTAPALGSSSSSPKAAEEPSSSDNGVVSAASKLLWVAPRVASVLAVSTSQRRAVRSSEADAKCRESGDQQAADTPASCPYREVLGDVSSSLVAVNFQILTEQSAATGNTRRLSLNVKA
ncbi:hypothetical protein P3T76_011505 [Phytophthora citrophthora]|uniref:Uncharacterized protein n=1 Tax=Phytophthora citrophthora TaxID=4793 RepID=A0AAD9G9I3_9STRA|nr:hypothetical protein P3T76_011505 [Phytophthora citrophthora]